MKMAGMCFYIENFIKFLFDLPCSLTLFSKNSSVFVRVMVLHLGLSFLLKDKHLENENVPSQF